MYGVDHQGNQGWFPLNYVDLNTPSSSSSNSTTNNTANNNNSNNYNNTFGNSFNNNNGNNGNNGGYNNGFGNTFAPPGIPRMTSTGNNNPLSHPLFNQPLPPTSNFNSGSGAEFLVPPLYGQTSVVCC